MYNKQPSSSMTFVSKYLQKYTSFYHLLLRNLSWHCAHYKNMASFSVSSTLFSTPFVLFSCTPFGTKSYIVLVVVWMAVCLTGYSDYLTGFREPLSTSYICHTGLKTVYGNHWQSFGLFVIMMWSLLYTLYDCHDNISAGAFSEDSSLQPVCYIQGFFLCLLRSYCCQCYCLFVCFGGSFVFRNVLYFFSSF